MVLAAVVALPSYLLKIPNNGGRKQLVQEGTINHNVLQGQLIAVRGVATSVYVWKCSFDRGTILLITGINNYEKKMKKRLALRSEK